MLGHFMAVAATLVMIYIAGVLVLAVLAVPVIILFSMHDDDSFPLTKAMYALASPRTLLRDASPGARLGFASKYLPFAK